MLIWGGNPGKLNKLTGENPTLSSFLKKKKASPLHLEVGVFGLEPTSVVLTTCSRGQQLKPFGQSGPFLLVEVEN